MAMRAAQHLPYPFTRLSSHLGPGAYRLQPSVPARAGPKSCFRPRPRSPGLMPLQLSWGDRQGRKPSHSRGQGQEGGLGARGIILLGFLRADIKGAVVHMSKKAKMAWPWPNQAGQPRTSTRVVFRRGSPPNMEPHGTRAEQAVSGP